MTSPACRITAGVYAPFSEGAMCGYVHRRHSKHEMLIQCCFDVGPTSKTVGGSTSRVYKGWHCIQRREDYYNMYNTQCDAQWFDSDEARVHAL